MTKDQIIDGLLTPGVVAIIRADSSEQLIDASRALIAGGVSGIEVTMTTPNALHVIAEVTRVFGHQALVGVGSVLDEKTAEAAIGAGAQYVVTPVLKPEVIAYCRGAGLLRTRRGFREDFSGGWPGAQIHLRDARSPTAPQNRPDRRSRCRHGGRFHQGRVRGRCGGQQPGQQGNPEEQGLGEADRSRVAIHCRRGQGAREIVAPRPSRRNAYRFLMLPAGLARVMESI